MNKWVFELAPKGGTRCGQAKNKEKAFPVRDPEQQNSGNGHGTFL